MFDYVLFIFIISLSHSLRKIPSCYSVASQLGRPTMKFTRLGLDSMDDRGTQKCYEKSHRLRFTASQKVRVDTSCLIWTRLVCPHVFFHHLVPKFTSTTKAHVEYWTMECPSLEQNKGTHFTAVELLPCLNTV